MQLSKAELGKLAARYQEKADRAYQNYQETGISRYDRERRNAEDLAEALRAAANASEEHSALSSLRAEFVWIAGQADAALAENAPREILADILENIVSYAAVSCHYARRVRSAEKGEA
jgi:hypothetical protein